MAGLTTGKFASIKLRRLVPYQFLIERDFIYLLDFARDVTSYQEQPFTLTYANNRRYTPDFLFDWQGKTHLVECKHHQYIQADKNRPKWDAARNWCELNNASFHVVLETQIRTGWWLENIKLLTDYGRYPIHHADIIYSVLVQHKSLTVGELMTACDLEAYSDIYALAYYRKLYLPLGEAPIGLHTAVTLPPHTTLPVLPLTLALEATNER